MAGSEDYGYGGLYDRAIRALSGARDWYSEATDPNRPRKVTRGDVNLPVAPPAVEKPWYEHIPAPLDIAEQVGRSAVEPIKTQAKSTGGKIAGALGATQESGGRAFGALMDATSTGSEKKPLSDVVWEGLKGVKSGYEAGLGATSASQEFTKRAPEETLSGANPVQRGMLGLGLDVVTDPTNLVPEKYLAAGAGALIGATPEMAQTAWLPPNLWKRARGVEGFSHSLNYPHHEDLVLNKGFGTTSSGDVLGRFGHAGYYTPKEAKQARQAGKPPTGQSNKSYLGGTHIPVDFPETTKILDVRGAPVPKEDFDVIIKSLDPVEDKDYIKTLTKAFNDQRHYAEGPSAVTHAAVRSGQATPEQLGAYYQKLKMDPVATDAIDRLNGLLSYPQDFGPHVKVKGSRGQALSSTGEKRYGSAALNQPSVTGEFGGIHYTDYVVGTPQDTKSGSMAFDPRQTLFAPVGSQKNRLTTPWKQGKIAPAGMPKEGGGTFKGVFPSDAPGGVSAPTPGNVAGPAVVQPPPVPPPSQVSAAESWAAANMNEVPTAKKPPKSWEGAPTYKGKVISITEQGTLKELAAAGRDLTKTEQAKLAAVKQWESGRPADVPVPTSQAPAGPASQTWADMSDAEKLQLSQTDPQKYLQMSEAAIAEQPHVYQGVTTSATDVNRPATMQQHIADLDNIFEEAGVKLPYELKEVTPGTTPEELHLAAIEYLGSASHYEAAEEVQKLWDMKLKGDTVDSPPTPTGAAFGDVEAPDIGKIDVFNATTGKTVGTFNSQAEVDEFLSVHPRASELDWAPHDPSFEAHAAIAEPTVEAPVDYDAQYKGFVDLFHDTNADPEDVMMAWKDLHPALKSKLAYEDADLFQTISKMEEAGTPEDIDLGTIDFDTFVGGATRQAPVAKPKLVKAPGPVAAPAELPSALPKGFEGFENVPLPKALDPLGKESIKSLDTHGSLDYLKNTYPEIAENFAKHSGTEMGSIESHTKDVLKQWKTQLTSEEFADISNRSGMDVEAIMNLALPLHDIGKPQAIASGDKTLQHSFTTPIIEDILQKEGFDQRDIDLATELFNHDMIGSLLQGSSKLTPQQVADELVKKADKVGMDPSDFAKLQLAFFQADASSYPFVTQYMKQQPNGGWISGSPKVKPIEDLIQGPTGIKSAAPTGADTGYQIKVKDAEDMLGGTKNKDIYTKNGQDYLFKEANPAYFADQEVAANKVANLAGLHPIKIEVTQMGGKTGTMQAAVGNNMNWPTLKEVDPKTLTAEELRDVIRNHPVDWLTGNMDAHGAQFLRTPNGIVGIDRGRAFKNYASNKLHPDYNPTGGVGYYDQIYNDIVKLYKKGELPQLSEADINAAIKQTTFKMYQNTNAISAEIADGLERSGQGHLKGLAKQRFLDLEKDLLKFWTGK